MPERPLLAIVPEVQERRPAGTTNNIPRPHLPSAARQEQRIGPVFQRLGRVLEAAEANDPVLLVANADGLEPERTLVFEVVGALADLAKAVESLPGVDFQLEEQMDFLADADFRPADPEAPNAVKGRLYACIPDLAAMRQIISLWDIYRTGGDFPHGRAKWKALFAGLHTIRPWGPADRLSETTRNYLEMALLQPVGPIRLEAELWFRSTAAGRESARLSITQASPSCTITAQCVIEEIGYHGVLVEISAEDALSLLANPANGIGSASGVMQIRPQSLMDAKVEALELLPEAAGTPSAATSANAPIRIGLLDGVPLHRHATLDGRIEFDDPDGFDAHSPVGSRVHGTAMASLILNGDLNLGTGGPRAIYARPVLVFDATSGDERTPQNSFPLDLIHRAVRRAKEGENGAPPVCPTIVVFNLSLGDQNQPFVSRASPWAKLLDYLSFKYRIVFIVSAGNISDSVLTSIPTLIEFEALTPELREEVVLSALFNAGNTRTMLSPAESANSLTVGASFGDSFPARDRIGAMSYSPYVMEGLPNLSSGLGLGIRTSIKPDMVFQGGKERINLHPSPAGVRVSPASSGSPFFGHRVAAPNATGLLSSTSTSSGTSDSAALVTHHMARIVNALDPAGDEDSLHVPEPFLAVAAKALAVHSCGWGEASARISSVVGPTAPREWRRRRMNVSRAIGSGEPDFDKVVECARNRAVMLHWGELTQDQSVVLRIPVPPELDGLAAYRKVTVTVAWLSPLNPHRAQHRVARLEISSVDEAEYWLGESDKESPIKDLLENGTVNQICLLGENVLALANHDGMAFRVSCRAQYDRLRDPVPYSVCVSLELAEETSIDVYSRVREILRQRVATPVRVGA